MTRVAISPLRSFNPRTPCGVRLGNSFRKQHKGKFQSTHSLRSATIFPWAVAPALEVSIHALLAECDSIGLCPYPLHSSFNPRTPCGVRLCHTTPVSIAPPVSIHALLAECDHSYQERILFSRCFNPRTPCGVRLPRIPKHQILTWFQSTHSLRSATVLPATIPVCRRFQSTHSLRSATLHLPLLTGYIKVSIHALLAECDSLAQLLP